LVGCDLTRKWYYKVMATDGSNNVAGVNITVYNVSNAEQFSVSTDSTGYTPLMDLVDYFTDGSTILHPSLYNMTSTGTGNVSFIISSHNYNVTINESEYQDILTLGVNETPRVCGIMRSNDSTYALSSNIITNGTCFRIQEENITIDLNNFNVSGGTIAPYFIFSDGYNNSVIKDGNFNDTFPTAYVIYLANGEGHNITEITSSFGGHGVYLENVKESFITNCNFSLGIYGIYLKSSDNNIVSDCIGSYGSDVGIIVYHSLNNTVEYSDFSHNWDYDSSGIGLVSSNYTTFRGITSVNNTVYGIGVNYGSHYNNISDSNFSMNVKSLLTRNSTNNVFLNVSYELSNESVGDGSELTRKWYYAGAVNDTYGNAQPSVNITVFNSSGDFQFNLTTGSSGLTSGLGEILQYVNNGTNSYHQGFYTVYAGNSSYPTINHTYNASDQDNSYGDDGFNFSQSVIPLTQGWNLISFILDGQDQGIDKNISVNKTGNSRDNYIGFSTDTTINIDQVNFINLSGDKVNWSTAVTEGKVQAYLKYYVNGTARYVATEDLGMDATNLTGGVGYLVQVNVNGTIEIPGVGGTLGSELFDFNKLMFYNGTDEVNITGADNSTNNWIFAASDRHFFYRDGKNYKYVCGDILDCPTGRTSFLPWTGYYVYSNQEGVTMYRRNY